MNLKTNLTMLLLCLAGLLAAENNPQLQLVQVTKESQMVSGRTYKLYYVSNSRGCYVKAEKIAFL